MVDCVWSYTLVGLNNLDLPLTVYVMVDVYLDKERKNKVHQFSLTLPLIERVEKTIEHEDGTTETIEEEKPIAETQEELTAKIEGAINEYLSNNGLLDLIARKSQEIELAKRLTLI